MIGSFYDSVKKNDEKRKVPKSVIAELNKDLPRGYQYVPSKEKGHLIIKGSDRQGEQLVVSILPDEANIPSNIKPEQLMEYLYRTQTTIKLHDARVVKDGKTLYLKKLCADPITGEDSNEDGYEFLSPEPFPPAMPMEFITEDNTRKSILFQRVPFDSMESIKFENKSFPALDIQWIIPEKILRKDDDNTLRKNPATITITIRPTLADSVEDVVDAFKIFKGYADGSLVISGQKIGIEKNSKRAIDIDRLEEQLKYWADILQLEKILGVRFCPKERMTDDDTVFCLELIEAFVYDHNVVYKEPFNHFHLGDMGINDELKAEDLIGKEGMGFSFTNGPLKCRLLGAEFEIYEAVSLLDFKIDDMIKDTDGKGVEIYLSSSLDSTWYLIRKYCKSVEDVNRVQKEMYDRYQRKAIR